MIMVVKVMIMMVRGMIMMVIVMMMVMFITMMGSLDRYLFVAIWRLPVKSGS